MTPISLEDIRELAGKNETISKSLSFGFLRGCTEEELFHLIMKHLYEKPTFSWVFRCYLEHSEKTLADQIASRLLSELQRQPDHHKRQTLAYCLDRLCDKCSRDTSAQITRNFLRSGKRYLRKYAYAKDLSNVPADLLEMPMLV